MSRASARVVVPGRAADAEALFFDPARWAAWRDGFGHLVALDGPWPAAGARRVWDSRPGGRGRVVERVTAHEARAGQTLEVEDERLTGVEIVSFTPAGDGVEVALALRWRLKDRHPLTPLEDLLVQRPRVAAGLRRTLERFAHERRAEAEGLG